MAAGVLGCFELRDLDLDLDLDLDTDLDTDLARWPGTRIRDVFRHC